MRPRGFTLIEVLVVVLVIGLLMALLIPAVQSARESARRAECSNRLRNIGVALSSHQSAFGKYPPGMIPNGTRSPNGALFAMPPAMSAQVALLPYLEQGPLYHSMNILNNLPWSATQDRDGPRPGVFNATAARTVLSVFLCPSDPSRVAPGCNFRAVTGPAPNVHDVTVKLSPTHEGGQGMFPGLVAIAPREIADGASQTIGFTERLRGSGVDQRFAPRRDIWNSGAQAGPDLPNGDAYLKICGSLTNLTPSFRAEAGMHWAFASLDNTLVNHVAPPNWASPDCDGASTSEPMSVMNSGICSARSQHPGGVHALFMDGRVQFVKDSITLRVWRALSTRAGKESLAGESY